MTMSKLTELSESHLVERFFTIAVQQGEAMLNGETKKYNRLYHLLREVEAILRARSGDGRRALLPLLAHDNRHVRMQTAMATMALEPEAARRVLRSIIDGREFPEALDAGMFLRAVDDGSYKPT